MAVNLIKALRTVDRSFHIEEVVANNGERRVVAHAGDEQGVRIIQELASLYRFKVHPTEVANSGSVILVEKAADEEPDEDEELVGDDFEDDEYDDEEDDSSDEEDGEEGEGDERLSDLGGGDGNLRYLNTAEGHKFALRVFTSMLGNEDMSRYAQFLIDLDRLFGGYVNKDSADFGTRKKKIEEAMVEVANEMQAEEDAIIEEAKKKGKKGRAGLLSALMKAISGDAGDRLASAWDKGDSSAVREGLTDAIDDVVNKLPKAENNKPKDEEAAEEQAA